MAAKKVSSAGEVNWYEDELILVLDNATRKGLAALAARVDGLAKINIVENDQIDTGFMLNTVYHVADGVSTYAATAESGEHTGKSGANKFVEKAPEAQLPDEYEALVAVGADYAVFQEQQNSFLFKALLQASQEAGGIIQAAAKEAGL